MSKDDKPPGKLVAVPTNKEPASLVPADALKIAGFLAGVFHDVTNRRSMFILCHQDETMSQLTDSFLVILQAVLRFRDRVDMPPEVIQHCEAILELAASDEWTATEPMSVDKDNKPS